MSTAGGAATAEPASRKLGVRQAAFIGVGAMVGAGIFSLLGAAGEVAGAAVWLSFLLAGAIAVLQGYSFAKFGARYPSAGGLLEYVAAGSATATSPASRLAAPRRQRDRHRDGGGVVRQLRQRGRRRRQRGLGQGLRRPRRGGHDRAEHRRLAGVARAQTVVVIVVIGILNVFAVVTLANINLDLLAFSGYPSVRDIVSSVALTFFAFLGFGVVTFTAKDLAEPRPRAAAGDVPRARHRDRDLRRGRRSACSARSPSTRSSTSGGTALAVAAEPVLGRAGYWLMSVTALFATAGATNAGLYPAAGLCEQMASMGQFPPALGRRLGGRAPAGLLVTAAIAIVLAVGFDLSSIASIGSAIALSSSPSSRRPPPGSDETGAQAWLLVARPSRAPSSCW